MSKEKSEEFKSENISRREFLRKTGILAGGTAVGASMLLAGCSNGAATTAADAEKWDYETDVVIIGLGGAGACAAIEAHDAGAKVLVLEKQAEDHHFPNTRMSGGVWHNPVPTGDRDARVEYVKAMMSGENIPGKLEGEQPHVSTEMAEMFADLIMENEKFLLAQDPDLDPEGMKAGGDASFPMFPKFKEAQYGRTVSTRYKEFAKAVPDLPPYKQAKVNKASGEAFFWALVEEGLKKKRPDVQILYQTPATSMIKRNGEIIGATATSKDGNEIKIKANKAVVLTAGGFEYSVPMRRAFLEGPGVKGWCFYGSPDNTGDGIEMAIQIGASLAKVAKSASRIEPAFPHGEKYEELGLKMGTMSRVSSSKNSCVVDNFGKRYTNEHIITDSTQPYRYQFYKEAVKYDMLNMDYPRTPSWAIFDETRRTTGSVVSMTNSTVGYSFLPWTKDNMDAINRGWIIKADTIEELAAKIMADSDNNGRMIAENLVKTIKNFNEYCATGKDQEFDRNPSTMGPVDKPPFYAMKHYPGGPNTKGGVDCNAKREVLDWDGKPIPRLFSAGEISSVFKFTYQAGGNITECVVCGRLAGKNAAALTAWS
ncbi:MAG: fumarate reductase [Gracilibacter sp. BRH_c7a]|nr:MAG: fumarate reductase [Gracilibacter sp. BRH_c7a]